ncbi:hypothetical protein AAG570_001888 [Ranatra chinensis]|uniref:Uncharacterized protein n=1 Tax=Ranatra chinensis TaxID=642074 RepID=A0ABD0YWC4_9HEMI
MKRLSWLLFLWLFALIVLCEGILWKKNIVYHHYPLEIHKTVPVPIRVYIDRPYPVYVPVRVPDVRPYPVERRVNVPYGVPVERPVPYPVVDRYPVYLEKNVAVPVEKRVPQPFEVVLDQPVPVSGSAQKRVPYEDTSNIEGFNAEDNRLQDFGQNYGDKPVDYTGV